MDRREWISRRAELFDRLLSTLPTAAHPNRDDPEARKRIEEEIDRFRKLRPTSPPVEG